MTTLQYDGVDDEIIVEVNPTVAVELRAPEFDGHCPICNTRMKLIDPNHWRCPCCGAECWKRGPFMIWNRALTKQQIHRLLYRGDSDASGSGRSRSMDKVRRAG